MRFGASVNRIASAGLRQMDIACNFGDCYKKIYHAQGNAGCIASNRITVDHQKIGYMYRDTPSENFPDSGWRFFSGDESEEYTDEASNFQMFDLNTVCNYDPEIIPFLDAPVGTAYIRQEDHFMIDN